MGVLCSLMSYAADVVSLPGYVRYVKLVICHVVSRCVLPHYVLLRGILTWGGVFLSRLGLGLGLVLLCWVRVRVRVRVRVSALVLGYDLMPAPGEQETLLLRLLARSLPTLGHPSVLKRKAPVHRSSYAGPSIRTQTEGSRRSVFPDERTVTRRRERPCVSKLDPVNKNVLLDFSEI